MTAAGIASLAAALRHRPDEHPDRAAGQQAVARAEQWMSRHFSVRANPGSRDWVLYYLRTLRRAGDLTGTQKYGEHDWRRLGAEYLLDCQHAHGHWAGVGNFERDPVIGTSFALLFLSPPAE